MKVASGFITLLLPFLLSNLIYPSFVFLPTPFLQALLWLLTGCLRSICHFNLSLLLCPSLQLLHAVPSITRWVHFFSPHIVPILSCHQDSFKFLVSFCQREKTVYIIGIHERMHFLESSPHTLNHNDKPTHCWILILLLAIRRQSINMLTNLGKSAALTLFCSIQCLRTVLRHSETLRKRKVFMCIIRAKALAAALWSQGIW